MSKATLKLEVATPDRALFSGEVTSATVPIFPGQVIGVLPGHAPLIGQVSAGKVTYTLENGTNGNVAIAKEGIVQILPEKILILTSK